MDRANVGQYCYLFPSRNRQDTIAGEGALTVVIKVK